MSNPNLDSRYAKPADVAAAISAQAVTDAGQYVSKSTIGTTIFYVPAPTGSSNTDQANIRAAIVAAMIAGGGTVQLQPGAYAVTIASHPNPTYASSYNCAFAIPGGVTFRGAGKQATVLRLDAGQASGGGSWVIMNWNLLGTVDTDSRIENLTIDGQAHLQTSGNSFYMGGIGLIRTWRWQVQNVGVRNIKGYGNGPPSETFAFETQLGTDTTYRDCDAYTSLTTLATALTSGTAVTSLTVKTAISVGSGTTLLLNSGQGGVVSVVTSSVVSSGTVIPINSYTPTSAIPAGTPLTGETSTGFSNDQGTLVKYENCRAWGMTDSMGFTNYSSQSVYHTNCSAWMNGTHGFNSENSTDVRYVNCNSGLSTSTGSSTVPYGASATIGNTASGFVSNGQSQGSYLGCIASYNGNAGLIMVQTSGYQTPSKVIIGSGSMFVNNNIGISVNCASFAAFRPLVDRSTVIKNNTTAGLSLQPSPGYITETNFTHVNSVFSLTGYMSSGSGTRNVFGCDLDVYLSAGSGTITAVALDGSTTGQTSGYFLWSAGGNMTITYTGTPTWLVRIAGAVGNP